MAMHWNTLDVQRMEEMFRRHMDATEEMILYGKPFDREKILKKQLNTRQVKDHAIAMWDSAKIPMYNSATYLTYQRAVAKEKRIIQLERRRNAEAQRINFAELDLFDDGIDREKEKIVEVNGCWKGLCPWTQEWEIPIQYKREVKFNDFKKFIKRYGNTKKIALPATIEALMREACRKGMNRAQMAELMVQFCADHCMELSSTVSELYARKRYRACFVAVVDRIDHKEELQKVNEALRSIVRKPHHNIIVVTKALQNVSHQSHALLIPDADEPTRDQRAKDFILRYVKHFITSEADKALDSFLAQAAGQTTVTLDMIIDEIQNIENSGSKYRIQSPRSIPKDVNIYDMVLRVDEEVEVHTVTTKPEERKSRKDYLKNKKGRKQRSGTRDKSGASTRSGTTTRSSSTNGFGSKSRSPSASVNPVEGGQIKHPNKSGNERKPSQYNTPSRGGSKTRSSSRSGVSPARGGAPVTCYRCGHPGHIGRDCFRYRSSTKTYCEKCEKRGLRLYHDPYYCNGAQKSQYRSPSTATRDQRQKEIKAKNGKPAQ